MRSILATASVARSPCDRMAREGGERCVMSRCALDSSWQRDWCCSQPAVAATPRPRQPPLPRSRRRPRPQRPHRPQRRRWRRLWRDAHVGAAHTHTHARRADGHPKPQQGLAALRRSRRRARERRWGVPVRGGDAHGFHTPRTHRLRHRERHAGRRHLPGGVAHHVHKPHLVGPAAGWVAPGVHRLGRGHVRRPGRLEATSRRRPARPRSSFARACSTPGDRPRR